MTASSSEVDATADMAAELIQAKIDAAQNKDSSLTHMLRMGSFHMEIVPSEDINIEDFFTETMKRIFKEYPETSKFWNQGESVNGKHYG